MSAPTTGAHRELTWWQTASLLTLSGWALTLPVGARPWASFIGQPGSPELASSVSLHWLVHQRGLLGATHSRLLMYPTPVDRLVEQGFPLDALLSGPLTSLLGWPAGYTLLQIGALVACGLSAAWLSWRWWGSGAAALTAGVAYQCSPPLLGALADGALGAALGAAVFPLAAGLLSAPPDSPTARRDALLSGLVVGIACLFWWSWWLLAALGLGALLLVERRRGSSAAAARAAIGCLIGAAAITAVPLWYTLQSLIEQPSKVHLGLSAVFEHQGVMVSGEALLESRDLDDQPWLRPALTLLTLLALPALWRRSRRWLAPAAWLLGGLALAAGPRLDLSGLPGPYAALMALPGGSLDLTPHRALLLAALGAATLIGGVAAALMGWLHQAPRRSWRARAGLRRLPPWGGALLLSLALLCDAALLDPRLPLPAQPGGPSERALQIARGLGPALVLPPPAGATSPASSVLIDQVHHGRPLAVGWLLPTDVLAPVPFRDAAQRTPLGHLFRCGVSPSQRYSGDAAAGRLLLANLGLTEVYLDTELGGDASYRACVGSLLGEPVDAGGPYAVFALDAALQVDVSH